MARFVMHVTQHIGAWILIGSAMLSAADDIRIPEKTSAGSAPTQHVGATPGGRADARALPDGEPGGELTNAAVAVIARVRGIAPETVTLVPSRQSATGPFEIDIHAAADPRGEAAELSRVLGARAAVIFEETSADGNFKTNRTFRSGTEKMFTAPAGPPGTNFGTRRLYVWPQGSAPSPARNVRLRVAPATTNR